MREGRLALFYDAQAGAAAIVTFDSNGEIADSWEFTGWRKTWEFVPGRFHGWDASREVLLYDRQAGEAIILTVGRRGDVVQGPIMKFRTSWDLIVASNLLPPGTGSRDEAFLYDRAAGEAALVDVAGSVSLTHTGFRKSWDLCVAGPFIQSELTNQVLLYDRAAGVVNLLGFDKDGSVKYNSVADGLRATYVSAAAGTFLGVGGQVVFYDSGDGTLLCVDFHGSAPETLSSHQLLPGCERLIVGRFLPGDQTEALIYRRASGEAAFVKLGLDGNLALDRRHSGWRTSWDIVTPLLGSAEGDKVLLYDRSAGDVCILDFMASGDFSDKTTTNLRRTWSHIVPLGASLDSV